MRFIAPPGETCNKLHDYKQSFSFALHRPPERLSSSFFSRDEDENIYYKEGLHQPFWQTEAEGDEEIIALLPQTDIIATGDTIEKSKANLQQAILDDYRYLSQHKDTLSERLLAQLDYLELLLQGKE